LSTKKISKFETVERLVRGGLQANVAIDRIYQAHGRELNVTRIINRMRTDMKNRTVSASLINDFFFAIRDLQKFVLFGDTYLVRTWSCWCLDRSIFDIFTYGTRLVFVFVESFLLVVP
jgi:hypothetical protein